MRMRSRWPRYTVAIGIAVNERRVVKGTIAMRTNPSVEIHAIVVDEVVGPAALGVVVIAVVDVSRIDGRTFDVVRLSSWNLL